MARKTAEEMSRVLALLWYLVDVVGSEGNVAVERGLAMLLVVVLASGGGLRKHSGGFSPNNQKKTF